MGGGPHSAPKKSRAPSVHLQSILPVEQRHQHLLLDIAAEHLSLHADVEDLASSGKGQAKLLLSTEGEALVPEKIQEVRKSRVVLKEYK